MVTSMKLSLIGSAFAVVAVLSGCGHSESAPASTSTTGASVTIANGTAISRLSSSRCDREVACNNVGTDKKFSDKDACLREVTHDSEANLRASECPRGILTQEFEKCLDEVKNEKCGNPFDSISRLTACRTSAICLR
jgi:hypothetical protein